jgi:hypothetical protein
MSAVGPYSSGNLSSAALLHGSSSSAPSQILGTTTSQEIDPRYTTVFATPNTQSSVNPPLLSNTTGHIDENADGTVNFTPHEGTILLEDALQAMIQQKNGNPEPLKILLELQENATKSSLPADTTLRATTSPPRQTHPPEPSVYTVGGINGIIIPRMDVTGQFTTIKVTNATSPITPDMLDGVGEFPMWVLVHQLRKIHHIIHQYPPSDRSSKGLLRSINLSKEIVTDPSVAVLLGYEIGYIPNSMIHQVINKTVDYIKQYYPIPDVLTTDDCLCFVPNMNDLLKVVTKAIQSTNGLYEPTITGYNAQHDSVTPQISIDGGNTWAQPWGGSRKQKRTTRKYKNRKLTYRRNKKNRTTKNKRRYSRRK